MASNRAPKQWTLTKEETITSFEAWRQNLLYILSLDPNFAHFLLEETTWRRKTSTNPTRGFEDDGETVPEARRRTAAQKVTHLELMLGQIANFCPVVSRNTIVKSSISMQSIWQAIRAHFGFQSTGSRFLDFNNIRLEPGERPEDLYQRLVGFIDDNLLRANGNIQHHGENVTVDEEITPSLENVIVITWLRLIHPDLPTLVKQRYGTELRSKSLASLKPEISQALDSLLDEIQTVSESKILRTAFQQPNRERNLSPQPPKNPQFIGTVTRNKTCPLCKQANRAQFHHYLSKCPFLPTSDRQYLTRARQIMADSPDMIHSDSDSPSVAECHPASHNHRVKSSGGRVSTKCSPHLKVFYNHHALQLTLDTGAETSMIKASIAKQIGAPILKTKQTALQADGITPLTVTGKVHLKLHRNHYKLQLDALVVEELDVDILAGTPFMAINDISVRPSRHQISIQDSHVTYSGTDFTDTAHNRVRRTQSQVLRAPPASTVVWPGDYSEFALPAQTEPDATLAIEPRPDCSKSVHGWPNPHIIDAVVDKVRILNSTNQPTRIASHEHFCQALHTRTTDAIPTDTSPFQPVSPPPLAARSTHSSTVHLDPDYILPADVCASTIYDKVRLREIQSECPDLRRTHAHLKQGSRPSTKVTNIKDVKRYLNVASIAKDGLLVVPRTDPLSPVTELVIVPRSALDGLITALHLKLDHPTKNQLHLAVNRHFYALDMTKAIDRVYETCHTCASLRYLPPPLLHNSTSDPPSVVGVSFAADVIRRSKQNILVLRETSTSFTSASIIPDEKSTTLRDSLSTLFVSLHSPDGPAAIVRVDPAPGFIALQNDPTLRKLGMTLEIGRVKNVNKNPVAKKAVAEVEEELRRKAPDGSSVTPLGLSLAISRLNSRLRRRGISAHEMWTHRDQFSNSQIPINDQDIIKAQHKQRTENHPHSERSKNSRKAITHVPSQRINVGDLVYLYTDRDKTKSRSRYLVVLVEHPWCFVKKFTDTQLRAASYKVRFDECYRVSSEVKETVCNSSLEADSDDDVHIPPEAPVSNSPTPPEESQVLQPSPPTPSPQRLSTRPQRQRNPPNYLEYEQC